MSNREFMRNLLYENEERMEEEKQRIELILFFEALPFHP